MFEFLIKSIAFIFFWGITLIMIYSLLAEQVIGYIACVGITWFIGTWLYNNVHILFGKPLTIFGIIFICLISFLILFITSNHLQSKEKRKPKIFDITENLFK